MTVQSLSKLKNDVPVRVRTAIAIRLIEMLPTVEDAAFSKAINEYTEHCWRWVGGEQVSLTHLYRAFEGVHLAFTELTLESAPIGDVGFLGAYCALMDVYGEAWELGMIAGRDLPSEVCEGDDELWDDFAVALAAIDGILSPAAEVAFDQLILQSLGDPTSRDVTISRSSVVAMR